MNFKKFFITAFFSLLLILPIVVFATTTSTSYSYADIQAKINSILQQIADLQAKLKQLQAQQQVIGSCHSFNANLGIGSKGEEVSSLLNFLVREGVGQERSSNFSGTYDEILASYVTAFQMKYKTEVLTPVGLRYGTGYFGPMTRAKMNALYGCNKEPIACTMDAKLCPDGSYVGRDPQNNCEFKPCPTSVCITDTKLCPDGTYVPRDPQNNCEFKPCPGSDCSYKWWLDLNNASSCSYKQFCGLYMYYGLRTFETESACQAALASSSSLCQDKWWYDSDNRNCARKQFCGTYMYNGLKTFDSESACVLDLASSTSLFCSYKWWFDSNNTSCSYKQFCGAYMYYGLQTFNTQADCQAHLPAN